MRLVIFLAVICACKARDEEEDIRNIPGAVESKASPAVASSLSAFVNPELTARAAQPLPALQLPPAGIPNLNPASLVGGLLAPQQPAGLPQAFGAQPQSSGLLGVLNNLGRQLTGAGEAQFGTNSRLQQALAVGLNNLLPGSQQRGNFPQIPRIPAGAGGPPIAGIPNVPGLPLLPGATGPNGQIDFLNLFSIAFLACPRRNTQFLNCSCHQPTRIQRIILSRYYSASSSPEVCGQYYRHTFAKHGEVGFVQVHGSVV